MLGARHIKLIPLELYARAAENGTPCVFVLNQCRRSGYKWKGAYYWQAAGGPEFESESVDYEVDRERPRV